MANNNWRQKLSQALSIPDGRSASRETCKASFVLLSSSLDSMVAVGWFMLPRCLGSHYIAGDEAGMSSETSILVWCKINCTTSSQVVRIFADSWPMEISYIFITADKTFPLPNKMNWVHSRSAFLTVTLDVDYSADADRVLDQAEEKLHGAIYKTVHGRSGPMAEALSALGHSIESLDQLVNFLDGVVDVRLPTIPQAFRD